MIIINFSAYDLRILILKAGLVSIFSQNLERSYNMQIQRKGLLLATLLVSNKSTYFLFIDSFFLPLFIIWPVALVKQVGHIWSKVKKNSCSSFLLVDFFKSMINQLV